MKRPFILCARASALAAALVAVTSTPGAAEVSVTLDGTGQVLHLNLLLDPANGAVWTQFSDLPQAQVLNPAGDMTGDLMPSCGVIYMPVDDPTRGQGVQGTGNTGGTTSGTGAGTGTGIGPRIGSGAGSTGGLNSYGGVSDTSSAGTSSGGGPRIPIAIWPRLQGADWEIMYSVWDPAARSWRAAAYLETLDNQVDDFAPRLYVCGKLIYAVWQRHPGGLAPAYATGNLVRAGSAYDVLWQAPQPATGDTMVSGPDARAWPLWRLLSSPICTPGLSPGSTDTSD